MPRAVPGEAARRTVAEPRIIDLLLLHGWPFEMRSGLAEGSRREAGEALEGLVSLGLPFGEGAAGDRRFDPVEVFNFVVWAGPRCGDPTWPRFVLAGRRNVLGVRQAGASTGGPTSLQPLAPQTLGSGRYAVTIRRTFNLRTRPPDDRVRLRLPLPIEDAELDELRIDVLEPGHPDLEATVSPARLDVVGPGALGGEVTVAVRANFRAWPYRRPDRSAVIEASERRLYTRPREGLICVTDRIAGLAARLAAGETDDMAVLRRFWRFMFAELALGKVHYDQIDPACPTHLALDLGWCDCRLGAALLAALCRARGVPARLVNGYLLHPAAPGMHSWIEAWIEGDGWRPFDLTGWGLALDAGDEAWRDHYFGQLDHRMVVERPPRLFTGLGSSRLPRAWTLLTFLEDPGTIAEFRDRDTDTLVYRDHVTVARLDSKA